MEYFNQSNKKVSSIDGKNLFLYSFKVTLDSQEQHP